MAETTKIAWTDHTWSPWEGCTKISPACDHCYAARMNGWLKSGENWGPGAPRLEYSDEHWKKPVRWAAKALRDGTRPKVFPSVCDPFDNEVRPELRAKLFDLINATQPLTWLLLTKRIGNVPSMLGRAWHKWAYAIERVARRHGGQSRGDAARRAETAYRERDGARL